MAVTITDAYVQTYETNVRHLAQQGIARLRPWVMERSPSSEQHVWQIMGTSEAVQKSTRKVSTPDQETPWTRRVSSPLTWHIGDVVEPEDIVQMLVDPHSNYAQAHAMGMRRAFDDSIIAAATGTALDGLGNNVTFPAGQLIGTGAAVIDFTDFTKIQEKFLENNIDPEVPKVIVVGPNQVRTMLETLEMTSRDYMELRPLADAGIVNSFMGFTIICSTRLLSGGAGRTSCLAFTKKALGFQVNKDIWSRATERDDLSYMYQLYSAATFGCVRVEDQHIVHLDVLDAV